MFYGERLSARASQEPVQLGILFRDNSELTSVLSNFAQGKVHGSLARAGKVKGQTPKVEAAEKKKQPRGDYQNSY